MVALVWSLVWSNLEAVVTLEDALHAENCTAPDALRFQASRFNAQNAIQP